jgi:branched-chain amino acid aminotransferase
LSPFTSPQDKLPYEELKFGRSFTDHMLEIDWDAVHGWQNPVISPYHYFSMSPASTALHYGIEVRPTACPMSLTRECV